MLSTYRSDFSQKITLYFKSQKITFQYHSLNPLSSLGNEEVRRERRFSANFGGFHAGFAPFGAGSQASAQASANAGSFGVPYGGFAGANAAASANAGSFGYGR
jgi:hypothetical protein